jgi:hypothetical protein
MAQSTQKKAWSTTMNPGGTKSAIPSKAGLSDSSAKPVLPHLGQVRISIQ